jgi:hypothetical protein
MCRTKTNRDENDRIEAAQTALDRILATEEALIPSSGFLASVMGSVREEAAAPPPIPFPWKRAVPGMVLTAGVFGWGAFELISRGLPVVSSIVLAPPHLSEAVVLSLQQAGWVAFALAASLLSWLLSRRLTARSGLL